MKRTLVAALLLGSIGLRAQTDTRVPIHVAETGGIRRSTFPVTAHVPLPRGSLTDAAHAKLALGGADVPAQMTVASRWPDGSIQELEVDFSASPGPNETLDYMLVYGPAVQPPVVTRGLAVTEDDASVQVGNIRFSKSGVPLLASVKYRDEAIGTGVNGFVVTDVDGAVHDLSTAENMRFEVRKRGPLAVQLIYTGAVPVGGTARAMVVIAAEMPSSKSWVKLIATVLDPGRRVRDVSLHTPLALGPAPWVWDFGTTRWTYGSLRGPGDAVVMTHNVRSATDADWTVTTTSNGREQVAETSRPDKATFANWGHVQGSREVVAFAMEQRPNAFTPGTYRIAISGAGATEFRFTPAAAQPRHAFTVYQHYVGTPVQIGAATSPAAILTPPTVTLDRDQYVKSGVPAPAGVR